MVTFMKETLWKEESKASVVSRWVGTSARPWGSWRNVPKDKASEMRAKVLPESPLYQLYL